MQGKQDKDEDEILIFVSLCTSILQNPSLNFKQKSISQDGYSETDNWKWTGNQCKKHHNN